MITMDTITRLNTTDNVKIYWLFIYSYLDKIKDRDLLPKDKLLLFPLGIYTPLKNMVLPSFVVETDKALDLSKDDDLDVVLNKFNIKNVVSISELVINKNTNLIAIEVNKKLENYYCHKNIYFYTIYNSPEYFINTNHNINKHMLKKLRISIGSKYVFTTNVTFKKIFNFLFKDYFEAIIDNTDIESCNKSYRIINNIKDKVEYQNEYVDNDDDGYTTDDSDLSLYSYNVKHNIKYI